MLLLTRLVALAIACMAYADPTTTTEGSDITTTPTGSEDLVLRDLPASERQIFKREV